MTVFKLTTQAMTTHNGYRWTLGETRRTNGEGDLCGPGWLHYYHDPVLAVMLNPIHADIANPRLFEATVPDGAMTRDDHGLKGGATALRLDREIALPEVSTVQRVAFAILCAKAVYRNEAFNAWADRWLAGTDRTAHAAYADADAAYAAAYADADAAYAAAAAAAHAAAADAAAAAHAAAAAAYAAADATNAAAAAAAYGAARAAHAALDIRTLAHHAIT